MLVRLRTQVQALLRLNTSSALPGRVDGGDEVTDLVGGGIHVKWQVGVELAGRRRIGLTPVVGNHELRRPGVKIPPAEDLGARLSNPSKIVAERLALELEIDQVPEAVVGPASGCAR